MHFCYLIMPSATADCYSHHPGVCSMGLDGTFWYLLCSSSLCFSAVLRIQFFAIFCPSTAESKNVFNQFASYSLIKVVMLAS